jgi:hypothetical protein
MLKEGARKLAAFHAAEKKGGRKVVTLGKPKTRNSTDESKAESN